MTRPDHAPDATAILLAAFKMKQAFLGHDPLAFGMAFGDLEMAAERIINGEPRPSYLEEPTRVSEGPGPTSAA